MSLFHATFARIRAYLQHILSSLAQALTEEPTYEAFGTTLASLMSSFTFTFFSAGFAVHVARR